MAHVLVVDDEAIVREMLRDVLESAGHTAITADDGDKALRLYRAHTVDLVITDLIMPLREGLETILELKRLDPQVRIIAISGGGRTGTEDYLDMAEHLGAQRTLHKPLRPAELLSTIDCVLANGSGAEPRI